MRVTEVRVPSIGDFSDVEIIDVLVKDGDTVAVDDPLITLESDKASMDVPSPHAGTVQSVKISQGDRVSEGSLILEMTVDQTDSPTAAAEAPSAAPPESSVEPASEPAPPEPRLEQIRVPDIGDFEDVEIIEVMVKPGDEVGEEDPLITLESDKAAMDVPSPYAGEIKEVVVATGDRVSEGDPIATIETVAGRGETTAATETPVAVEAPPSQPQVVTAPAQPAPRAGPPRGLPPIDEAGFARAYASPAIRKLARELGVDLIRVRGTGLKGRINAHDVKAFVKSVMTGAAAPEAVTGLPKVVEVDFAKFGEIELKPLSRIQKISGPRLHASWVNLPHVTQFDEADITELEETRQELKSMAAERGIKLTPLAFIVKACVKALQEYPQFNSSLDPGGEQLVFKKYFHIGFAADTPQGLVVPVIRDADQKDIYEIAEGLGELSGRAREGKLKTEELQGGTFTISSLGGIGGTAFTPIINAPEVAILGVSRSEMKPVFNGDEFLPRLMLPLSLSYDHRVIDGASAVRFTTLLKTTLADVQGLIEAIP